MVMEVGNLVRQALFKGIAGKYGEDQIFDEPVYRYGIVTSLDAPEPVRRACSKTDIPIEVYFTPTAVHPVAVQPYMEYVAKSLLEVISDG